MCYLMIKPMPKLADFLDRELIPGTPVVSLSFGSETGRLLRPGKLWSTWRDGLVLLARARS